MAPFKNKQLLALAFAHFSADLFSGMVSILIASQTTPLDLSEGQVGILALAFSLTASLSQPLFGLVSDHKYAPYLVIVGVIWQVIFIAVSGLATTYGFYMVLVAVAGLGSGAFHPPGASGVLRVTTPGERSSSMSIFMVGGNGGFALGPLVGSRIVTVFGPSGTLIFAAAGVVLLPILLLTIGRLRYDATQTMQNMPVVATSQHTGSRSRYAAALPSLAVITLLLIIFFRQSVFQMYNVFLPQQFGVGFGGEVLTVFFLMAALGGFLAGFLADRIGRDAVIISTLALAVFGLVFLRSSTASFWILVTAGFSGFMLNASLPLTLLLGQELFPRKPGMITGIILGFTFISGGIGGAVAGQVAERIGVAEMLVYGAPVMAAAALSAVAFAWITRLQKQTHKKMQGASTN